jgi:hypothetical protein
MQTAHKCWLLTPSQSPWKNSTIPECCAHLKFGFAWGNEVRREIKTLLICPMQFSALILGDK